MYAFHVDVRTFSTYKARVETHSEIIERLGGIRKVASVLGHKNHTTVQGWFERNRIPMDHWPDLIRVASEADQALTVEGLMPEELRDAAA